MAVVARRAAVGSMFQRTVMAMRAAARLLRRDAAALAACSEGNTVRRIRDGDNDRHSDRVGDMDIEKSRDRDRDVDTKAGRD